MDLLRRWLKKFFVPSRHNEYHPHLLRHQSISVILLLVIILEVGFFIQTFYVFDKTRFLAAVLPGVLTSLINEKRVELALLPLLENQLLAQAAQLKAEDMAKKGYFAHVSPDGKTPWYWFEQVGYKYAYAGENLAVNFFESEEVSRAWLESPTHRANIVKADYTEMGIGIAQGTYEGRPSVFVAQLFGTPLVSSNLPIEPTTEISEMEKFKKERGKKIEEPIPVKTAVLEEKLNETVKETVLGSTINEVLTSPRRSINYLYFVLGAFMAFAIVLALVIRREVRHPGMVARGAGLIVLLFVLSFINLKILGVKTLVPASMMEVNATQIPLK